jgi:hypothetical protein
MSDSTANASTVRLTVSITGEFNDCISAVSIDSQQPHREAIAPPEEVKYFIKDCGSTWNANAFAQNVSFVVTMAADDWDSWLLMYEVADLDQETIDLLCA